MKIYDLLAKISCDKKHYVGKKYKVVNGVVIDYVTKCNIYKTFTIDTNGGIDIGNGLIAYFSDNTEIEEIKPEPKPVSFMDAVKAYSEGEIIKCKIKSEYGQEREFLYNPAGKMNAFGLSIETYKDGDAVTTLEILQGQWYIEDKENE